MLNRKAIKFLKEINFDKRETREQIKKVLRIKFLEFCKQNDIKNSIGSYREWRSVVMGIYGFDLTKNRPKKTHVIVETDIELF